MKEVTDRDINLYLDSKGIKHACKGRTYLMVAIRSRINCTASSFGICDMYGELAEYLGAVSPLSVERNIRHAIHSAGNSLSNKEFISCAADDLRYKNDRL